MFIVLFDEHVYFLDHILSLVFIIQIRLYYNVNNILLYRQKIRFMISVPICSCLQVMFNNIVIIVILQSKRTSPVHFENAINNVLPHRS